MNAVLRFANGDVEHHELAVLGSYRPLRFYGDRVVVERNDRQITLVRTRTTHDGRPVFVEDPTAAIFTT